jgi:hypothetical protein
VVQQKRIDRKTHQINMETSLPFNENRKDLFLFNAKEAKKRLDKRNLLANNFLDEDIKEAYKNWRSNWELGGDVSVYHNRYVRLTENKLTKLHPGCDYYGFISDVTYMLDFLRYKEILMK